MSGGRGGGGGMTGVFRGIIFIYIYIPIRYRSFFFFFFFFFLFVLLYWTIKFEPTTESSRRVDREYQYQPFNVDTYIQV